MGDQDLESKINYPVDAACMKMGRRVRGCNTVESVGRENFEEFVAWW